MHNYKIFNVQALEVHFNYTLHDEYYEYNIR